MKSKDLLPLARSLGYRVNVADGGACFSVKVNRRELSFAWDHGNYCDTRFGSDPSESETVEIWNCLPRSNPAGYVPAIHAADMLVLLAPRRKQKGA